MEPAASMCSGVAKLSQPGGVHISAVSALLSQSQDGDCQADPAVEGNEPNSTWRRISGLKISAEPSYGDATVPQSPTGGHSPPIRFAPFLLNSHSQSACTKQPHMHNVGCALLHVKDSVLLCVSSLDLSVTLSVANLARCPSNIT